MKKSIFHYVLATLEGVISGACFYHGQKEEQPMRRALLFVAGAGWFALSLLDGLTGGRELREAATKTIDIDEINGGNDNE